MKKIFRTHFLAQVFIYALILAVPAVMLWVVHLVATSETDRITLLVFVPLALIIDVLMYSVFRTIAGNKLVITESRIEYYENGLQHAISYAAITSIDMGMSRTFYDRSGTIRTPVIHYTSGGKSLAFGLPHWMNRKKILREITPHIDEKIIAPPVKEKYL